MPNQCKLPSGYPAADAAGPRGGPVTTSVTCLAATPQLTQRALGGPRLQKKVENPIFFFSLGPGRRPRGLIKPVRVIVAHSRVKRSHGNLFREIFLISSIFDL